LLHLTQAARLAASEAAAAAALRAGAQAVARHEVMTQALAEREAEYQYKDAEWRTMYRAYNYMKVRTPRRTAGTSPLQCRTGQGRVGRTACASRKSAACGDGPRSRWKQKRARD
jgi:hypothetical protein